MLTALRLLHREFRSFVSDERGSYLAFTAFLLMGVVGFAGMGIDLSMWYQEKRTTQNIADAAAVAAVLVSQSGGDMTAMQAAALEEATRNGYEPGPNNSVTVVPSVATPSGSAVAVVDVEVYREVPLFLLAIFKEDEQIIAAAASGGTLSQGSYCVIGLDNPQPNNTTSRNIQFTGSTTAYIPCGVHSNSTTDDSFYIGGNASLMGTPGTAVGQVQISGSATTELPLQSWAPYVTDPLATRVVSGGTCPAGVALVDCFPERSDIGALFCDEASSLVVNSDMTIDPSIDGDADGNYKICGDLTVRPGDTLTLKSGIYYVEDGDILFQGNVAMFDANTRVTIVLTGTAADDVGEIDIRATANVQLWATNTDGSPYEGVVFMQDPDNEDPHDNKFNGGANLDIRGYVYMKNDVMTFNGGSASAGCTYLIARSITLTGNSDTHVQTDTTVCPLVGIDTGPVQNQVVLVQ